MATVVDKSWPGTVDKKYASPNRTTAVTPVGALTPLYRGEIVQLEDAAGAVWFRAVGTANTSWLIISEQPIAA